MTLESKKGLSGRLRGGVGREKQIPGGNDNKKSKNNGNCKNKDNGNYKGTRKLRQQ